MTSRIAVAYQLYMIEHGEPRKIYFGYAQRVWFNKLRQEQPHAPVQGSGVEKIRDRYKGWDVYLVDDKDYVAFGA